MGGSSVAGEASDSDRRWAGAPAAAAARSVIKHAGGRRRGQTRTREVILASAQNCFAERGFDGTSLRRIADVAGVDQALVHHFFGTKENLFLQALELPAKMQEALGAASRGGREGVGERMVRAHLSVWDDLSARPALMTMARSAAVHGVAAERLRHTATSVVAQALSEVITGEDARLRASLVATQLIGLAMTRYILLMEPLASADHDAVARYYGLALQAIVDA
ncbi:TetR family transcriptional regulator [Amycolatopsis sp. cmx-4-61]|uniref:TetR/AcrR family transcriptional regulator n=1 Tax=Amycolatopsis sp. cmx-4-61 TaxID=2790937 RepID=UPI00397B2FC1